MLRLIVKNIGPRVVIGGAATVIAAGTYNQEQAVKFIKYVKQSTRHSQEERFQDLNALKTTLRNGDERQQHLESILAKLDSFVGFNEAVLQKVSGHNYKNR